MNRGRASTWLAAGALVVVTLAVYAPALHGEFLWDDRDLIPDNPLMRASDGLWRIWTDPAANPVTEQHHPLVHTAFWLEYRLWGEDTTGYHVVNVLLHAANALLAWRLLARLGVPAAWLAGWLFALHPVHVESTAWIVERKDQLSTLFYLLAGLGYESFVRSSSRRAWAAALAAFAAAMFGKTMVATFPAAVLIVLWWKHGRITRRDVLSLVPFVLVAAAAFLVSYHVLVNPQTLVERPLYLAQIDLSVAERVLVAGRAVCFYAGKLVWPVGLNANYPQWSVSPGVAWHWVFPGIVVVAVLALAALSRRIGRGPLAALLFYCATLAPALGVVSFYLMAYTWVADRFQYLAALGPFALAAAAFAPLLARRDARGVAAWTAVVVLLAVLGGASFDRCRDYRDLATLLEDAIAKGSTSARLHYYAAQAHERAGRIDRALEHYRRTIEVDPEYYRAYLNLGAHLMQRGEVEAAIPLFETAIRLHSDEDSLGRNNLAVALASRGELDRAVALLREALARHPDDEMTRINLGYFVLRQGRAAEAVEHFERVLERNAASVLAARGLREARALAQRGGPAR